jgi:hypothetical protein
MSEDNVYEMVIRPQGEYYSVSIYYTRFDTLEFKDTIDFVSLELLAEEYGFDFSEVVNELDKIEKENI